MEGIIQQFSEEENIQTRIIHLVRRHYLESLDPEQEPSSGLVQPAPVAETERTEVSQLTEPEEITEPTEPTNPEDQPTIFEDINRVLADNIKKLVVKHYLNPQTPDETPSQTSQEPADQPADRPNPSSELGGTTAETQPTDQPVEQSVSGETQLVLGLQDETEENIKALVKRHFQQQKEKQPAATTATTGEESEGEEGLVAAQPGPSEKTRPTEQATSGKGRGGTTTISPQTATSGEGSGGTAMPPAAAAPARQGRQGTLSTEDGPTRLGTTEESESKQEEETEPLSFEIATEIATENPNGTTTTTLRVTPETVENFVNQIRQLFPKEQSSFARILGGISFMNRSRQTSSADRKKEHDGNGTLITSTIDPLNDDFKQIKRRKHSRELTDKLQMRQEDVLRIIKRIFTFINSKYTDVNTGGASGIQSAQQLEDFMNIYSRNEANRTNLLSASGVQIGSTEEGEQTQNNSDALKLLELMEKFPNQKYGYLLYTTNVIGNEMRKLGDVIDERMIERPLTPEEFTFLLFDSEYLIPYYERQYLSLSSMRRSIYNKLNSCMNNLHELGKLSSELKDRLNRIFGGVETIGETPPAPPASEPEQEPRVSAPKKRKRETGQARRSRRARRTREESE
jgi:hypothetical protein